MKERITARSSVVTRIIKMYRVAVFIHTPTCCGVLCWLVALAVGTKTKLKKTNARHYILVLVERLATYSVLKTCMHMHTRKFRFT